MVNTLHHTYWVVCMHLSPQSDNFSPFFNMNTFLISFNFDAHEIFLDNNNNIIVTTTAEHHSEYGFFHSFVFKAFDKCFSVPNSPSLSLLSLGFGLIKKKHFFSSFFVYCKLCVYISSSLICFCFFFARASNKYQATKRFYIEEQRTHRKEREKNGTTKRKSTKHENSIRHQNLWRKIIGYDITPFKLIMGHITFFRSQILLILCDFRSPSLALTFSIFVRSHTLSV